MSNYIDLPLEGSSAGVNSLNTLTGALTLVAGPGISIAPGGAIITISATGGSGTVTSVALVDSTGLFNITGSPITTSGTLTLSSLQNQSPNTFFAGPATGGAAPPTFRAITAADIAALTGSFLLNGGNTTGSTVSAGTTDAQEFDLITNGLARVQIDSDGMVGIGFTPQTGTRLVVEAQDLTPTLSRGLAVGGRSNTTSNIANNTFGIQSNAIVTVDAGFSNSAINAGIIGFSERGTTAADAGDVMGLVGIVAGIDIEDTNATASTSIAAAFAIQNTVTSGSVIDLYDIVVFPGTLTGSTITNHYGLFINPDDLGIKINYLTGLTQFGGTYALPTSVVEINGDLGLNGSTSGKFTQAAANITTSYSIKWPASQGAANTIISNSDGSGNLSWISTLLDAGGALSIDYFARNLWAGALSIGFGTRQLFSSAGTLSLDWSTSGILSTGTGTELRLAGGTSGYVGVSAPAAPVSYSLVMPAAQGASSTVLTNDGAGNLSWVTAAVSLLSNKELFTLSGTNITNQYIDLTQVAQTNSIDFLVKGGGVQIEGTSYDYTVSYTGGGGGNTRITFKNDLATGGVSALIAGDIVVVKYLY